MPLRRIENQIPRTFKVYDADKQLLLGIFEGSTKAGKFLGLPSNKICDMANRRYVNKTNKLGLRIAVR